MNKLARTIYGAVALASPMLLAVTTPAAAHPLPHVDVATIEGSGTISPGLGATPSAQSISFDGTATVVGSDGVLTEYDCAFSGEDPAGSAAAGAGTVAGSCGPIVLELCVFVREAAHVDVECVSTESHKGGAQAKCVFRPHDTLPTTAYDLICEAIAILV